MGVYKQLTCFHCGVKLLGGDDTHIIAFPELGSGELVLCFPCLKTLEYVSYSEDGFAGFLKTCARVVQRSPEVRGPSRQVRRAMARR